MAAPSKKSLRRKRRPVNPQPMNSRGLFAWEVEEHDRLTKKKE